MIRVLLADDHGVVRDGLGSPHRGARRHRTRRRGVQRRRGGRAGRPDEPDVVLMDLDMPVLDGIEATRQVLADRPDTAVIVLTAFSDRPRINGALEAGARGYLLKDVDAEEWPKEFARRRGASRHWTRAPRARSSTLDRSPIRSPRFRNASARCSALLVEGLPNKLIARRLEISEKTVKSHLTRIFRELGVTDRTQAALWAERHGVGTKGARTLRGLSPPRPKSHCGAGRRGPWCRSRCTLRRSLPSAWHSRGRALAARAGGRARRTAATGGEARVAGRCGGGATSSLRALPRRHTRRVRGQADDDARRRRWRVVLVHERRVEWRGSVRTRRLCGSFRIRRTLRDLDGPDG